MFSVWAVLWGGWPVTTDDGSLWLWWMRYWAELCEDESHVPFVGPM